MKKYCIFFNVIIFLFCSYGYYFYNKKVFINKVESDIVLKSNNVESNDTGDIISKDLGNNFDLKQDENYTYLYYNGNKVYYWDHVSKLMPFTWDEACDDLFSVMQNTLPENQIGDWKQKIWEKMSLSSQKTCIKTNLLNSISVIKIDGTNYYIVERKKYENKADNFIFDILSNKVFLSNKDLNDFDNILNTYYSNKYGYE